MKASGITTQAEAASGHAIQRRTLSISSITSIPRTSSPHNEDADEHLSLPTYQNVGVAQPEEKEGAIEETPQSIRHHYNAVPETQTFNSIYPQIPQSMPVNANLPFEDPPCDLLPHHPAVWVVKGKDVKVSSLSAAILLNDGILTSKDLAL
jgi:hypothetical protein